MKLLFDQNLSFKLCQRLADLFPDSSQVRLLGLAEADDHAIWHYAQANGFTLVSQDSDFADMATLFGPPPRVIWLRCGNQPTEYWTNCSATMPMPSLRSSRILLPPAWRSTETMNCWASTALRDVLKLENDIIRRGIALLTKIDGKK